MAEITKERVGELLRGVFEILLPHPEGLAARDVLQRLEDVVPPTDFERSTYPKRPNIRRFEKIVRFSTINVVKAGWLVKDKGTWSLTDEGRAAFKKITDPEAFALEAQRLYKEWAKDQPPPPDEVEEDAPNAAALLEEAEEGAWAEIQSHLEEMNPYDLQNLVAALLRAMGYHVSWVAPPGPDRGIDVVAHTDPLGIEGARIKVQVKRQQQSVGVSGLRSFMAVLGGTDVGIFVNTGGFSKDAETEARSQENRKIMLVDLKRLFDLWVEHYASIEERHRTLLPLRAVYYLAPSE